MTALPRILFALLVLAACQPIFAADNFAARPEVQAFIEEMHEKHGFKSRALNRLFARTKPIPAVIQAILPPRDPASISWQAYRARYVEAKRIALGLHFWREHRDELAAARLRTGVAEEIVIAIIGIETIYGRNTGRYGTFAALTTLAFDYPVDADSAAASRSLLFRHELEELLLLARETQRDPLSFKGSYAGAIGLPQFLPSSIRRYAVDGNDDNRVDLEASPADAIASVANFLQQHGWERNGPMAATVQVAGDKFASLLEAGIVPRLKPGEMASYGVVAGDAPEQPAALIALATPQQVTEYRLGYRNFYAVTRYNRSSFYAMAVRDLAQELKKIQDELLPVTAGQP
jgi:membrane-bound lytic murein transglycosylase B